MARVFFLEFATMEAAIMIGSQFLFASPIILGVAAFVGIWMKEEFYKHSFYESYED